MKQIKLSDTHYIVVDETQEIKVNDWCIMLDSFGNLFSGCQQYLGESAGHYLNKGHIKITHSTQWIKGVETYPLSVAKEIAGEVDVEKKGEAKLFEFLEKYFNTKRNWKYQVGEETFTDCEAIKILYNQCLEDNKDKKYTAVDLSKAIDLAQEIRQKPYSENGQKELTYTKYEIIKQLSQPTEVEVEIVESKLKRK